MVALKVKAIGDTLAVMLPDDVRDRLALADGSTLHLTETPDGYRMTSRDPSAPSQMDVARDVMQRYRNALRELAK
ncbi:AbrB/MazE/SpoVT family DNA-binding domain-containing protein [Methylobacterium terrae]|uniref:AbrB/MazE/SpoVT family DNA-binding domain-containing protein n=1 Tax=Methylobacterium terrae TaxID=2202827 RepID=A0A2U8WX38_9HYPH|nr:AbrB/MazE/SpoVT family DNA-binding domain-containing protein [Methylobacterium terrae]AWN49916.1 AbrB/MazE/SpoVT family DNA-binding domain-containing protein [Methylobacterium terrae]